MDSNRMISVTAICVAVIALIIAGYSIISENDASKSSSESQSGNFTDDQIIELVDKLKTKGGKIYTTQGTFDLTNNSWSLSIEDRVIVAHFKTYNQDYYIPSSSIDYIWVYS